MASNTVNRGWLRKQIEAGNVEVKCDYSMTDDYAWDNASGFGKTDWMPARIRHPKFTEYTNDVGNTCHRCIDDDRKDGYMNLDEHDLTSRSGMAYRDSKDNSIIRLSPYSNLCYSMRIVATKKQAAAKPAAKQQEYPEALFL